MGYIKSKFCSAVNDLFRNAAKLKNEILCILSQHIVNRKTVSVIRYRSCGPGCDSESEAQQLQLKSYVAVYRVTGFQVTSDNVNYVCNITEAVPFCQLPVRITFLNDLHQ